MFPSCNFDLNERVNRSYNMGSHWMKSFKYLAFFSLFVTAGCHTMRFDISNKPIDYEVHDRKAYFIGGLVPTRKIDLSTHCPDGTVAIEENTTFLDGFLGVITLSIYTPRSSTYYCAGRAS